MFLTKDELSDYVARAQVASDYPARLWLNVKLADGRTWYEVEDREAKCKWEFNDFQDALDKFNEVSR